MTQGETAAWYAEHLHWAVFPCHSITPEGGCTCGKPDCGKNSGKHPLTEHGLKDASTDPAVIRAWWKKWPYANPALATGEISDVDVLDVDNRHGGDDSLRKLELAHGQLPASPMSITGGGGSHRFGRHIPGAKNRIGEIGEGLDYKTTGGYVILPPSKHLSGRQYVWEGAGDPVEVPLAEFPPWFVGLARQGMNGNGARQAKPVEDRIPSGQRNATLTSLAGSMRWRGMAPQAIEAALLTENRTRCTPPLPDSEVCAIAVSVGRYEPAVAIPDYPLTEIGLAERFVYEHGARLRFCHQNNKWYADNGQYWGEDGTAEVERLAKVTIRNLYGSAAHEKDPDRRQSIARFAVKCDGDVTIRRVLSRAAAEEGIPILLTDFDIDPWLLNVGNGVVDLRTGAIKPHSRELLMRNYTRVEYHAGARSVIWARFLEEVTGGNLELVDALQVFGGYSATGSTQEEKLFMPIGPAGSGKSTLLEAIKAPLGTYAWVADFESFLHRPAGTGGVRSDIAELSGKRFVLSVEVDEGARLAEGLVKHLTGGDTMRARQLYQEGFLFVPQFKLWLAANHAPKARDDDSGLWRRILRIPLETVVPEERRDPTLKARLKTNRECQQAILAWLVEGAVRWHEEGLIVPACIRQATQAYRADQDPLRDFFADVCEFAPAAWVTAANIRKAYEHHCEEAGVRYPLGPKQFGERLQARGCASRTTRIDAKPTRIWGGVRLIP